MAAQQGTATREVVPAAEGNRPSEGVRAFIDPATGRLTATPSPEQVAALEALERQGATIRNKSTLGLAVTPLATGGYQVDLQNRFVSSTIVLAPSGFPTEPFDFVCSDREPTGLHLDSTARGRVLQAPITARASGPAPNLPSAEQ